MTCAVVVDGGGSSTRLGIMVDDSLVHRLEVPSCNERSQPGEDGARGLARALTSLWAHSPPSVEMPDACCIAVSNASTSRSVKAFGKALWSQRKACPLLHCGRIWIMNDIVPMVVSSGGARGAVVCGTGTGFAAFSSSGEWWRASGMEYLLSDEGGGFDIGLQGLRAVVRAHDGRGKKTVLMEDVKAWGIDSLDDLYERIYSDSSSKVLVASFTPYVLRAASSGDAAAGEIVARAARELFCGMHAVATRAGLSAEAVFAYGGSILSHSSVVLDAVQLEMRRDGAAWQLRELPKDPLCTVGSLASALVDDPALLSKVPLVHCI